jgi:hypothetical protein
MIPSGELLSFAQLTSKVDTSQIIATARSPGAASALGQYWRIIT